MSENYEKVKLLGEGAFGKAFLAKCFATKSNVVLKEINLVKVGFIEISICTDYRHTLN